MKMDIIKKTLRSIKKNQAIHFSILAILWIIALLIIAPWGNFPINDDCMFSKTVRILLENYKFEFIGWDTTHFLPMVPHLLIGYLFSIPLGFSHLMLRISTILLSIAGVIYFYLLLKRIFNQKIAFIGSIVLAFNPLYLILSYSFMTDVPFLVYTIITLYYFVKYFDEEKKSLLILAIVFSLVATSTRQLGVILPFVMILAFALKPKASIKNTSIMICIFLTNIFAFLIIQKLFMHFTGNRHPVDTGLGLIINTLKNLDFTVIGTRYNAIVFLSGLFLIPINAWILPQMKVTFKTSIFAFILLLPLIINQNYLIGNYINNFYIGPMTFKDTFWWFKVSKVLESKNLFLFITVVGLIASYIMLLNISTCILNTFTQFKNRSNNYSFKASMLLYLGTYTCLLLTFPVVSDRYILPLSIIIILIILPQTENINKKKIETLFVIFSLFALCMFSIASIRDFFKINTARWEAVDYLMKVKKVSPTQFDAGFEANGWLNYSRPKQSSPNKRWWWVDDDKYIVCLSPLAGYSIIKEFTFKKWIHNYANIVYVLERDTNIETMKPQTNIDFETINNDSSGFIASNQIIRIISRDNISKLAHSGKNALKLTKKTADSILFHISNIHVDNYCEMRFWANVDKLTVRTKVIVNGLQYDVELEKIKTEEKWTQFKCSFFASSWISDFTDNIDIKIIPQDNKPIIIDDVRLLKLGK